jgi:hypothetical protein
MNTEAKAAEQRLSEETAQEHLDLFIDYYEIDIEDLPKELKQAMTYCFNHMKRAIRKGRLEIEVTDGIINIRQNLKKPIAGKKIPQLVYKEINIEVKRAMRDEDNREARTAQLLGALTGEGETLISKLSGPDMSLAESLATVFLQI